MKKIIIPIGMLLITQSVQAQLTPTENYIQSRTYLDPVVTSSATARQVETVQYFDGLGRPKQVVNVKASPLGRDVVTQIVYDGFGRQVLDYLPVPQGGTSNGAIVTDPLSNATQPNIYGSEKIYLEKILENSPLDRVLEQKQVGNDWNTKPVKFQYDVNIDGEVKRYIATFDYPTFESSISLSGNYGGSQLYKNTVTDEDGNKTIEFKNGKGQVLLVRKIVSATENADTYYVYNNYDQLAYVIPPLASVSASLDLSTLDKLCYQYIYDGKNRLVEKKLPGKGKEYMVYDKQDRLILNQDTNLKAQNKWIITKYDQLGRVAYTGLLSTGGERAGRQNEINNLVIAEERSSTGFTRNGMTIYYTDVYFVGEIPTILSVNYYDTYPQGSPAADNQFSQELLTDNPSQSKSTKGLAVASYVKNIEDDNWTKSYTYYDTKGRVTGTHSINHLGGYTKTESKLDFVGAPKQVKTSHKRKTSDIGVMVNERFEYDNANRLTKHWHQVDGKVEQLLTENTYNEVSQLINKKVGNNLQSMDYAYNIRGWMTEINKNDMSIPGLNGKLFSYKIKYNQKDGTTNPDTSLFVGKNVKPMYNGNIAEVDWRSVESLGANPPLEPKRYGYAYDALNRLTAGYYQNPNNPWSKEHTEVVDYDLNGNIIKLYRTSVMNGTTAEVIDDLVYNYGTPTSLGNRLLDVKDNRHNKAGYEGGGNSIAYDANGNMINMLDKQILGINYNYLNLPNSIARGANFNINHLYRADGVKLHKSTLETYDGVNGTVNNTTDTDYLDGFQYTHTLTQGGGSPGGGGSPVEEANFAISPMRKAMEIEAYTFDRAIKTIEPGIDPPIGGGGFTIELKDEDLVFFPTAEGYYDYKKDQYIYQYKDHLGNARVSFGRNSAGALEITDANDYYPFGMNHLKTGNAFFGVGSYKNYKYNGKELQETGMYDYGARMYMPDLGRWGVVDPRSQYTHETYSYVWNNPISFNDPTGMQGELSYPDRDGKFKGETWKDSDGTFKWNGKTWTDVNNGSSIITQVTLTGKAKSNSGPGSLAMAALLVSQADSPVPGPADIVAAGMLIGAGVWWTYNQFAPPSTGYTTIADPSAGYRSMNTEDSSGEDKDVNGADVPQEQKGDGNGKPTRSERAQQKKTKNGNNGAGEYNQEAEHKRGARGSTRQTHENGQARKARDKGGEKGDRNRKRYK
ncbi:DUF6443 domain-containing protein [Chryseobacterium sp.]|uniref:DUF6443 domain-containing protein n=1 Tax=Chryseobacterium sp. TaxID=1871047 RepID=UPI0024E1AB19|nr:DUF6443 domain-containing protein [Chryseobacterium sp.]